MTTDYKSNVIFQHKHTPDVIRLLKANLQHMVNIRLGTQDEDSKQATDMVMYMDNGGAIGVRVRRYENTSQKERYRHFTIREKSAGGSKTELDKLRDGWGDWYFYGWENQDGILDEWIIVNLNVLHERKAFHTDFKARERWRSNRDGKTAFVWFTVADLRFYRALVAGAMVDEYGYRFHINLQQPSPNFGLPQHLLKVG